MIHLDGFYTFLKYFYEKYTISSSYTLYKET